MNHAPTIGIDIGGSKIAAGLVDRDGRVLRRAQAATPSDARDAILATAVRLGREVGSGTAVAGVGIGAGGVIVDGVVTSATALLTGWAGTDLVVHFATALGAAAAAALNDVHAHGVGEAWCGAGAGRSTVLVIAAGTGLGAVVVLDGKPLQGAHGTAGHLGHVNAPAAGDLLCSCGAVGHLEAISSGYGIVQGYHRLGGDPRLGDARHIVARAATDPDAAQVVRTSATALGSAVGGLITIIDPDVVIISGGLSSAGRLWWDEVRTAAAAATLPLVARTPIVPAGLGADAGVIGAARFLRQTLGSVSVKGES
ncbi:transcriptional regulator [Microlunatus endophyticus]|uniref:Transcriptional regulator n=1 Tax=Microlunatus endophyticus TaxID=1716077 RepID=A0A917W6G7_9ACTN|nr:ROK family protein [Microlunatus endophyticus]GGL74665.1 transcriptional regulator [Microlunatus endophyticus]